MAEQRPGIAGEFDESMTIDAPAERVFDFVSDVQNLPKYLPTTRNAMMQQGDRVRVQGRVVGQDYDSDGYLRKDREHMRLEWGADERYYKGHLEVKPRGERASEVRVHLSFRGGGTGPGPTADEVRHGIRDALQSIQNEVTGRAGTQERPGVSER